MNKKSLVKCKRFATYAKQKLILIKNDANSFKLYEIIVIILENIEVMPIIIVT